MKVRLSAKNLIDNSISHSIEFDVQDWDFSTFNNIEGSKKISLLKKISEPYKKAHNIPHGFSQYYSWCIYEILDDKTNKTIYTLDCSLFI